ncbi:MAG: flagellar biosynthesis protein FlhB [Actinobacteria bacterium]|nr:flagellar biosynthesis protein FlhB [Actinomycetota bacterium]
MEQEGKTEKATPKRRAEERRKGNVARTPDLDSALIMLAGFMLISFLGAGIIKGIYDFMLKTLTSLPVKTLTQEYISNTGKETIWAYMHMAGPFLICSAIIGLAANVAQVRFVVSFEHLKNSLSRLNPANGIKRIFSLNSLVSLGKNILRIAVVCLVSYKLLQSNLMELTMLSGKSSFLVADKMIGIVFNLGSRIALIMIVIAIADYIYQKNQFEKRIMMTKQEVKQEYRQQEGDPMLKSARKSRHIKLTRARMIRDVPDADVVITNPTTYAVALKYRTGFNAPKVTAKGARLVAKKIKEIAIQNNVPVIENKFVAQAIYKSVEIGQEIPPVLYKVVAEILAYVFKLKNNNMKMESI